MAGAVPPASRRDAAAVAKATLGGAVAVAERLPDALGAEPCSRRARDAFAQAFEMTAAICAAVAVATAVVALVMLRRVPTGESPERDVPLESEGAA